MPTDDPVRVLFVGTENAARSQMAEGLLRAHGEPAYAVHSAGTDPGRVHPLAIRVMDEMGIDIRAHTAADVSDLAARCDEPMDYVVTLCRGTRDLEPSLRAREMVIHQPFDDPDVADGSEADRLSAFRQVRDALADGIDRAFARQAA